MEQKKTLWIIAATGVFLLVVIGAAIILYSPSNYPTPSIAQVQVPNQQTPSGGWELPSKQDNTSSSALSVQTPDFQIQKDNNNYGEPGQNIQQVRDLTVIAENTNVYNVSGQAGTTTIDLNTLKSAAEEANLQAKTENTSYAVENTAKNTVTAKTGTTSKPAAKPAASAKPKTSQKVQSQSKSAQSSAQSVAKAKYWVQAAAYTAKKSADNARTTLSENKIPAEVFTYTDNKNKVYYRVRVGPYTTKSEAEYWKNKILQIDQFKDSKAYITDSTAAK